MAENHIADTSSFEAYLQSHPFKGQPENLYSAMNYIMQLGGKRLRPQLVLLAFESVAGKLTDEAFKLALAIETFHNFSLVHDDIMDNAPIRRGKPSVHEKWGSGTAILAGDNLLISCYALLLSTGFDRKEQLLKEFTQMAIEVCEGQQMDMNVPVDEKAYLGMIRLKTAVLPACAMKIGALAAGAGTEKADQFYGFGMNLGMAFQLQDDYLDCFGDAAETGKQAGGDIIENKKTILYHHSLLHLNDRSKAALITYFNNYTGDAGHKVERVRDLFREAGSDTYVLNVKKEYEDKALHFLDRACPDGKSRNTLFQLFSFLQTRRK